MMRRALQIVLPLLLLAGGFVLFKGMMASAIVAEKHELALPPASVEAVPAAFGAHPVVVDTSGVVQAAARVDLVPQVVGRVVDIATGLTPGRRFAAGAVIARIDSRDYEAAVTQAEAAVAQARLEVALEESRGRQAGKEWEMLGAAPEGPLATRELQLGVSRANLASAESRLATARHNLERTRLVAPFDGIVTSESLEVGQVVGLAAPVASLIGTARFRVRVSVPVSELDRIDVPEADDGHGSEAAVRQPLGDGRSLEARGYVLRLLAELDPETRTATVLIAIDDPLDLPEGTLPILPGAFVDVSITGRTSENVAPIPRSALIDGDGVWVVGAGDRLERRQLDIAWTDGALAYVRGGLAEGERVITTQLALPVVGMPLAAHEPVASTQ